MILIVDNGKLTSFWIGQQIQIHDGGLGFGCLQLLQGFSERVVQRMIQSFFLHGAKSTKNN
jgi:hypothetical protein